MHTFWKQAKGIGFAVGRRGGLLTLVPVLLLCAWLMTGTAHAAEPTYLFEVTTGVRTAKGDEEKIDLFIITYTTESSNGGTFSKYLFPAKDGWDKTYELLTAVNKDQESLDNAINKTYGYKGTELGSGRSRFQSYSTDQYLFTTREPIKEITRVQFFAADSGSWNCRAMRVFRVDELGGLYRWNTASNDCYIDFKGDLIAEGTMSKDLNIAWTTDKLIYTKDGDNGVDITLKTSGFSPAYAHHERQDHTKKTLALRFDFADTYGSGLEALGAMSKSTLTNMGLAETMAVTLYYIDCYGEEHAAKVPAVLNAAEFTKGLLSANDLKKPIGGFAQQGEGMALGVFLPDYVSLVPNKGITVTLGAEEAKNALGVTATTGGAARAQRTNRIRLSESDNASFVTMAVYDLTKSGDNAVQISAKVNDSTGAIEYTYRGSPAYYQPVANVGGSPLRVGENRISLTAYESGKLLAPRDKTERYLLELTTDSVAGAGTKDDIMMSINWTDLEGNAKMSDALNVRELSRDFNGWWYGSAEQDIAYYQGVAEGKTLRFFVPLQNVKKITDIKVWMSASGSHDDWQMKDLSISTVDSFGKRAVNWQAVSADGVTSSLSYDRAVQGRVVYRFADTAANPVLIQQSAEELTDVGPSRTENLSGGGSGGIDVMSARKVDWSKLRYSMTFREASQELALGKERYLYAVTVHVAGNAEATLEDGDCGSKNLFYFGLIFKNGRSGMVLANQQLPSDGFIAGSSQTFTISTNDDYGDVTAVQIIPEDSSEDSDLFDKLNIASIDVKRESNSALVPVWTVSQVGWISIDYRDKTQMQSVTGMAGRSVSEVARTYTVDGSTFDVNFMLAITTEDYPEGAPQLRGNLSAVVKYDSYNPSRGREEISDVTKSMYAYMNHAAATSDDVGGRTVSDTGLMFRAGHTDRFYFSLSDVRSIKSIDLQVISAVSTTWNISDVSLFMVNGEGSLILNSKGEYQRVYRSGEELTELAHGTSETAYHIILEPYDGSKNSRNETVNGGPGEITVSFSENEIEINPGAAQWKSIVTREPVSENDTLNVFLYPEEGKTDPVNGLIASMQYSTAQDTICQTTTGVMRAALYKGQEVYYRTNINASRMTALNSMTIFGANGGTGIRGGSVRAVVQRVRSGVVINTWDLSGRGYTDPGGISLGSTSTDAAERQRVLLQMGTGTETAVLSAITDDATSEYNNLAVAIYYRADDPSGMELRSPYVYLTDQGYTQLRSGQLIELDFNQLNIGEVTGIALISTGDVRAAVEGALVVDEVVNGKTGDVVSVKGTYSSAEPLAVSNVPYRMNIDSDGEHDVKLLSLTFATAMSAADDVSSGTKGPVRMSLGYYDAYGNLIQRTYPDIRPYISDGSAGFSAGSKVRVEMLVPDVYDLRWIELEPLTETAGAETQRAMWTLDSLTADLADGEVEKYSEIRRQIIEGEPLRLSLADILIAADIYISDSESGKEEMQTVTTGDKPVLVASGEALRLVPRIVGSYDTFTATLVKVEPTTGAFGRAKLTDTRGYTEESIAARAAAATDSREAAIWNAAKPQTGFFEFDTKEIRFLPPRNYTGQPMQYQIQIISAESESSVLVIDVTVESESDPVQEQLDALAKTIEAEREAETQRRLDALESANGAGSVSRGAGTNNTGGTGE